MTAKLWPAVLGATTAQFSQRLRIAKKLSPNIHLDVMDGIFVQAKSIGARAMLNLPPQPGCQLHLMVQDPVAWYPVAKYLKASRVIIHAEIGKKLSSVINFYNASGFKVDVALNPNTRTGNIETRAIDGVVVMGVRPGKYGAAFTPSTFKRLRQVHKHWAKLRLTCDGGMDARTISSAVAAGATDIVVGSDIMLNRHPTIEWKRLKRLTEAR